MQRPTLPAFVLFLVLTALLGPAQLSAQEKEFKAANAKLVVYGTGDQVGGAFTYVDKKHWVEDTGDGRHRFTETGRDEWSIYLTVDNDSYTIHIDLLQKQIFITEKDKPRRELYKIMKAY